MTTSTSQIGQRHVLNKEMIRKSDSDIMWTTLCKSSLQACSPLHKNNRSIIIITYKLNKNSYSTLRKLLLN